MNNRPSSVIASAFVLHCLSSTHAIRADTRTYNLSKEIEATVSAVDSTLGSAPSDKTANPYLLALTISTLFNYGLTSKANELMPHLEAYLATDGSMSLVGENTPYETVTLSGVRDRVIETTALALICFRSNTTRYAAQILKTQRFLLLSYQGWS